MASVSRELRLGTRGSPLALWQAHAVAARIAETGGPPCRIVAIKTSGDRLQEAPLSQVGGKRLFVKEIEDALVRGEIDLAVHSAKDMPAILPDGLTVAAVLPREDPLDAVVLPASTAPPVSTVRLKPDTPYGSDPALASPSTSYVASGFSRTYSRIEDVIAEIGQSPVVGTGSVRRVAQLIRLMPGARFEAIRGNLDTRLRKLDEGAYEMLVLAAAGLRRLGYTSRISMTLPPEACVPAPGQGIVAIEIRELDDDARRVVAPIDDADAADAFKAERALVAALGGGCQTPVGGFASAVSPEDIELVAAVVSLDGSRAVRGRARGRRQEAAAIGASLGGQLIADGADEILAEAQMGRQPAER